MVNTLKDVNKYYITYIGIVKHLYPLNHCVSTVCLPERARYVMDIPN